MASETRPDEKVRSIKRKTVYAIPGMRLIMSVRTFPGFVTSCELRKPGIPARNCSSSWSSSSELNVKDSPRTSMSDDNLRAEPSVSFVKPLKNRLFSRFSTTEILYQLSKLTSLCPCNSEATALRVRSTSHEIPVAQNQATVVSGV